MSYKTPIAVVLTALFLVAAVGYLALGVRRRDDATSRVGDLLHVAMSLAMLSMPWSWGRDVAPPMLQIIVFGLATGYFGVLLVGGDRFAGHAHHGTGNERRALLGYHVVMMAAMVVMGLMMRDMHSSGGADHSMPGMNMGSSSMSGMSMQTGTGWTVTSWILVAVFGIATVALVARWVRTTEHHALLAAAEAALLVLMSAGMALAFVPTW